MNTFFNTKFIKEIIFKIVKKSKKQGSKNIKNRYDILNKMINDLIIKIENNNYKTNLSVINNSKKSKNIIKDNIIKNNQKKTKKKYRKKSKKKIRKKNIKKSSDDEIDYLNKIIEEVKTENQNYKKDISNKNITKKNIPEKTLNYTLLLLNESMTLYNKPLLKNLKIKKDYTLKKMEIYDKNNILDKVLKTEFKNISDFEDIFNFKILIDNIIKLFKDLTYKKIYKNNKLRIIQEVLNKNIQNYYKFRSYIINKTYNLMEIKKSAICLLNNIIHTKLDILDGEKYITEFNDRMLANYIFYKNFIIIQDNFVKSNEIVNIYNDIKEIMNNPFDKKSIIIKNNIMNKIKNGYFNKKEFLNSNKEFYLYFLSIIIDKLFTEYQALHNIANTHFSEKFLNTKYKYFKTNDRSTVIYNSFWNQTKICVFNISVIRNVSISYKEVFIEIDKLIKENNSMV